MTHFSLDYFLNKKSSWEFLKETQLPIFIYGMGDGALKILSRFEKFGITCSGFFASDEFVRGHYFEGHKVHKLSEIEEYLDDFIIVLVITSYSIHYTKLYDLLLCYCNKCIRSD